MRRLPSALFLLILLTRVAASQELMTVSAGDAPVKTVRVPGDKFVALIAPKPAAWLATSPPNLQFLTLDRLGVADGENVCLVYLSSSKVKKAELLSFSQGERVPKITKWVLIVGDPGPQPDPDPDDDDTPVPPTPDVETTWGVGPKVATAFKADKYTKSSLTQIASAFSMAAARCRSRDEGGMDEVNKLLWAELFGIAQKGGLPADTDWPAWKTTKEVFLKNAAKIGGNMNNWASAFDEASEWIRK